MAEKADVKVMPKSIDPNKIDMKNEFMHSHLLDSEFLDCHQRAQDASKMDYSRSRQSRFFHIVEMLKLSRGVPGATLEAGCFRGMASNLICQYRRLEESDFQGERHMVVDSFEGLSPPVDSDGAHAKNRFDTGVFTHTSVKHVKKTLIEFPKVRFFKGWIPEILKEIPEQRFRFVHIDVDLYEPTRDCLNYFYERMAPGGIIVCDDYGPWPNGIWEGCSKAVHEFCEQADLPFAKLNTGNAVFVKR